MVSGVVEEPLELLVLQLADPPTTIVLQLLWHQAEAEAEAEAEVESRLYDAEATMILDSLSDDDDLGEPMYLGSDEELPDYDTL